MARQRKLQKSTKQQTVNSAKLEKIGSVWRLRASFKAEMREFQDDSDSKTSIAMEDRHAFRLGDRVNCTLCLGSPLKSSHILKKAKLKHHKHIVSHTATPIHPLCIISILHNNTEYIYTLCLYYVISYLRFLSPRNGLVGTVRFLGATYFAPGLNR